MDQPTLLFSILLTLHLSASGVISTRFTIVNKCNYTVWPATTSTSTTTTQLSTTGFALETGESSTITAPTTWTGRVWGRTLCTRDSTAGNFSCVTGDCGSGKVACGGSGATPPATLAEFALGNNATGLDFFDVSLVDGYNIPMLVVPSGNCSSTGCPSDVNAICPEELAFRSTVVGDEKKVVACKSACVAFKEAQYCCTGKNNTAETCKPTSYSQVFKKACPQAYSYLFDDETSTFTCSSADYNIIFCPASNNTSLSSLNQSLSVGLGDSLTAGNGTIRWLSTSGDFAFGFYQLPNELYLLAIWYDKIPNKTIIWYANGDSPAPKGSRLELNDTYGLVLRSPQGSDLWRSSDFTSGTIYSGLMNDDGNFQLRDQDFVTLWDTFSHPTDTLVPTQVMELNGNISSRQGELNLSRGRFKLHLQEDGNFVFNLINLPSNYSYEPYYSFGTADDKNHTNVGLRVVFDKSGFLYILKKSGEMFSINRPDEKFSTDDFYYRATINNDGVFTIEYHPKDPKNEQSWVVAKTIPENICLYAPTDTNGEGVCGFNSICTLKDDKRPMCNCPEGYSLIDSNDIYGGCIPDFQVICQADGRQGPQDDLYIMKELPNTDWPNSYYEKISPCSLQDCTKSCLQDCLCVMVISNGSSCLKKKLPLSFGRKDQGVNGTSVIKLMKNNDPRASFPNTKKDHATLITVISVLLGSSVFVILMLVGAICFGFFYNRKKIKSISTNKSVADRNLQNFTFKELVEATSNFREELGRGSCSIVYKGTIEMTSVAIKKLDKLFRDSDKEFKTEVNVIGQTHHRNLVRLIGYCNEGQHRILVYEFMTNGTLASFLFKYLKPNWEQRVHIALGIARGLVYLHEECCTQIIHCDIKPQNILLDDDYNARISDFGLSKILSINQSRTETGIRGTRGYVAPDWFRGAPITTKVDTYSFGVLLLEIICCRKNVEEECASEEKGILTDWAYDCFRRKRIDILLENDCEAVNDMKSLERFVMIAFWCIQEDPSLRPTMKTVMQMLEGIVEVAIPPSPYLNDSVCC